MQTTRLAKLFELLTGSIVLTRPEKFPCKIRLFWCENPWK